MALGIKNIKKWWKDEEKITDEKVADYLKKYLVDDGTVKGGVISWANYEVAKNIFSGIHKGTQLYTDLVRDKLYIERLQINLERGIDLDKADYDSQEYMKDIASQYIEKNKELLQKIAHNLKANPCSELF